jgi:hypothetical protein
MASLEDRIRARAHELWEADGSPDGRHVDYWLQAERELTAPAPKASPNEGEGNRSATRRYNSRVKKFAESGQVEAASRDAAAALDDPQEAKALRKAERAGKARSHGEDPAISHAGGQTERTV